MTAVTGFSLGFVLKGVRSNKVSTLSEQDGQQRAAPTESHDGGGVWRWSGLLAQCGVSAFGSAWSTGGGHCLVWDNQTDQSLVRRARTILSSLKRECLQTSLSPSWLLSGSEPQKGSGVNDPLPEASADAQRLFQGFLIFR